MTNGCVVPGCTTGYSRKEKTGLSVFLVPKCNIATWKALIPRQNFPTSEKWYVCEKHFEPRFIERSFKIIVNGKSNEIARERPKLAEDAKPTIFPNLPKLSKPRKCSYESFPILEENGSSFESPRKVVEILCFDGQQYRYIYRGNDTVCNIKLECADGVELFVSLEDLDELEPAILKQSPNKLLDLNAPDVTNDASPKDGVPVPKAVLSELNVKDDSPLSFLGTTFVAQGSNSDDGTVEDDSNVLLELCTQTGTYERKKVKSLCQENNQVYSCDRTKRTLKKKAQLQRQRRFKCHHCSKTFKTKVYYERHVKTHSDKSSFLCSDCGKSFSRNNQLRDHQRRVHNKGMHSKCDICARGFATTRDLKHHLKIVHNEKLFGCKERWTRDLTNS